MSKDMVNHPEHYETNGVECIDAMVASQGAEAVQNYCVCNAFKYIWRHQHKGKSVEDIQKAIWYLNKYVELNEDQDSKYDFTEDERMPITSRSNTRIIRRIDAYKLIDDLSKLNPIFLSTFPCWENDHILSIYSISGGCVITVPRYTNSTSTRSREMKSYMRSIPKRLLIIGMASRI